MSDNLHAGLNEKVDLDTAEQVMSSETSSRKDPGTNQRNVNFADSRVLNSGFIRDRTWKDASEAIEADITVQHTGTGRRIPQQRPR
jgi:hypothetical protein